MTPLREYVKIEFLKADLPDLPKEKQLEESVRLSSISDADLERFFLSSPQRLILNLSSYEFKNVYECIDVYRYTFLHREEDLGIALANDFYGYSETLTNSGNNTLDKNYPIIGFECKDEQLAKQIKETLQKSEYSALQDEEKRDGKTLHIVIIGKKTTE